MSDFQDLVFGVVRSFVTPSCVRCTRCATSHYDDDDDDDDAGCGDTRARDSLAVCLFFSVLCASSSSDRQPSSVRTSRRKGFVVVPATSESG